MGRNDHAPLLRNRRGSVSLMELFCRSEDLDCLSVYGNLFDTVSEPSSDQRLYLRYDAGVLGLCRQSDACLVWVDGAEIRRRIRGDFLLGRACGVQRGSTLEILDATAGLGLDGLALASSGQRVCLVERELVLWALLHNLLERLDARGVELVHADSRTLLARDQNPARAFDVVYFDPMFPARNKTALPAKRMQFLAELLSTAPPFEEDLIELARNAARSRVVVKRRLKDPAFGSPDWDIRGRSVRYDVYRARAQPSRRTA